MYNVRKLRKTRLIRACHENMKSYTGEIWWKNCRLSARFFFWIDLQKITTSAMPIFIAISYTQNWLKCLAKNMNTSHQKLEWNQSCTSLQSHEFLRKVTFKKWCYVLNQKIKRKYLTDELWKYTLFIGSFEKMSYSYKQ